MEFAPIITGPATMNLTVNYRATTTAVFTIRGNPLPTVTIDNTHDDTITWNSAENRLEIAPGLGIGTYRVVLTADNGLDPTATHTFTLTVRVPAPPPTPTPTPTPTPDVEADAETDETEAPTVTPPTAEATPPATDEEPEDPHDDEPETETTISLDPQEAQTLIENALATAQATGTAPTVTINLTDTEYATAAELNAETAEAFATANIAVTLALSGGEITISPNSLAELASMSDHNDTPITIGLAITPGNAETTGNFLTAEVNISVGDNVVNSTTTPITVAVPMDDFNLTGLNTHRIVAKQGTPPAIIGGAFDATTGQFIFETQPTGAFSIVYVETLTRLSIRMDSPVITDLADNSPAQVMDVLPIIQQGRTLLPVRFMAYALGADIDWTPATSYSPLTVHLALDGTTLSFRAGELAPGMDVPAQIINNRTMVPLRFISEFFGAVVTWDDATRSLEIIRDTAQEHL